MCGIAAFIPINGHASKGRNELEKMLQLMNHRGPDGIYAYSTKKVSIGMTRLAIVGGITGAQPIWNETKDTAVVCNGEIYNYKKLREQLESNGHSFYTDSDVEVIVHLYEQYGEDCVLHLEGTFAFIIWDERQDVVFIARDRIGVKPLFYAQTAMGFVCASELRALLSQTPMKLNHDMMYTYHTLRFAPAPHTIAEGIQKLPAGFCATIRGQAMDVRPYWSMGDAIRTHSSVQTDNHYSKKKSFLSHYVRRAVEMQQAPEVQSATLLSGGVDSTLLVGLQTQLYGKPPDTITISFETPARRTGVSEVEYNESGYARQVAQHFGCRQIEAQYSAREVWDALPQIIHDIDEPIADPTAIPLWFASQVAHENGYKVLYSGEGMDELFAGYDLYQQTYWLKGLYHIPKSIRKKALQLAEAFGLPGAGVLTRSLHPVTKWYQSVGSLFTPNEIERLLKPHFMEVSRNMSVGGQAEKSMDAMWSSLTNPDSMDVLDQMLFFDCLHWLPENTLAKSDKISMAHSVELRVPFLNEALVEFAINLPARDKIHWGVQKYLVRKTFADVIPRDVMKRQKAGFPVPITTWIYGEWKSGIESLLLDPSSYTRTVYRPEAVEALINSTGSSQERSSRLLWSLLTMEWWMSHFSDASPIDDAGDDEAIEYLFPYDKREKKSM